MSNTADTINIADAIMALSEEKKMDVSEIKETIENMILAAYQKTFGKQYTNCIIRFADDLSSLDVYARKEVVDGVYDPVDQIELDEAQELQAEAEIGDTLDIPLDPKNFEFNAVTVGKQTAHKNLNIKISDRIFNEYSSKVGTIVVGYYQRQHRDNIYVDLGKTEAILPRRFQSPRETFEKNDRIKALVKEVKRNKNKPEEVQVVLSRTDEMFVQRILEPEVPEIQDGTVMVKSIAREAGYRTKIAVVSNKSDVDPVGACVGLKGVRIQNVIREIEGEKIDVLRYDEDPHVFIKNALSPADVQQVVIKDSEKKEVLAVVSDESFSIAIGKNGQNVRLANRLCKWSIDVKNEKEVLPEELVETQVKQAAELLFSTPKEDKEQQETKEIEIEEIRNITDLPGVNAAAALALQGAGFGDIADFVAAYDESKLHDIEGASDEDIEEINKIINEYVEFEDEESSEEQNVDESVESEEEYFCPECGAKITPDITRCPKCGVELSFEEESEEE